MRRNLALDQPGIKDNTGVITKTINEENPPDENFLFGKAVGFRSLHFWDKITKTFSQPWVDIPIKGFQF